MKCRKIFYIFLFFYLSFYTNHALTFHISTNYFVRYIKALYLELGFTEKVLSLKAFRCSIIAYYVALGENLIKKPHILTIIDYTKPSNQKRLFVIDLKKKKVLFKEFVAHGKMSGDKYVKYVSNKLGSLQSSIGLYITLKPYIGKHGYALRLRGVEKGFNNNAERRHIVMHGAWYVDRKMIKYLGWIGHSFGCPAIPLDSAKKIIETIKNGSALYIYFPLRNYFQKSHYLNLNKAVIVFNQKIPSYFKLATTNP